MEEMSRRSRKMNDVGTLGLTRVKKFTFYDSKIIMILSCWQWKPETLSKQRTGAQVSLITTWQHEKWTENEKTLGERDSVKLEKLIQPKRVS